MTSLGRVTLRRFVLPARDEFSSLEEFERYSGPLNWNRQQGIYIYRADRLVQWGGWNGIRGIDEHTKLARASLEFDTDLDSVFNINVAKMRVTLPPQIRQMLDARSTSCAPMPTTGTARPHGTRTRSHAADRESESPSRRTQGSSRYRSAATRVWRCAPPRCRPASTRRSAASSRCWQSGRPTVASSLGLR